MACEGLQTSVLASQDLADKTWLSCPPRGDRPVLLLFQRRTPAHLDDPEGDQGPPQLSSGMLNCFQSHVSKCLTAHAESSAQTLHVLAERWGGKDGFKLPQTHEDYCKMCLPCGFSPEMRIMQARRSAAPPVTFQGPAVTIGLPPDCQAVRGTCSSQVAHPLPCDPAPQSNWRCVLFTLDATCQCMCAVH